MSRIFKLFLLILISLTTLNAINFGSYDDYSFDGNSRFFPKAYYPESYSKVSNVQILGSNYVKIDNDLYEHSGFMYGLFNTENTDDSGYFLENSETNTKYFIFYNSGNETYDIPCQFIPSSNRYNLCSRSYPVGVNDIKSVKFSYYTRTRLTKVTTCQPGEHFNTQTKQCETCQAGQSWDQENNICWKDCTDMSKNKWGFSNGTPDGSCFDCSNETTLLGAADCGCRTFGFGGSNFAGRLDDFPKCAYDALCKSPGISVRVYDPECDPDAPDNPDNNPNNPGGGNPDTPGDNNNPGGNSGNSGNSGGGNGGQENSGNDNGSGGPGNSSGGDSGNSSGGNNGQENNGNNNGNGSQSGNSDNGQNEPTFNAGDFKYGDVEKKYEELKAKFEDADKTYLDEYKKFESGIKQFIENVKGNGLSRFDKGSTLNNCPKSYSIPIINKTEKIEFDICEIFKPMRNTFYYVAYASFFLSFLILTIKLMIFSF